MATAPYKIKNVETVVKEYFPAAWRCSPQSARFADIILLADIILPSLQWEVSWGWGTGEGAQMFARIDAPQILFLAAASILIIGIAYLF